MEQIRLLSRREKEVVTLLLQGKSNKQIALSLDVSERTIEFHLKNIYAKLQVNSRVELILKLGKTAVDFTEKLGESTVDVLDRSIHNGKQPTKSLKNIIFTIKKEFAMLKIAILESVESFLEKRPLFLLSILFFLLCFLIRYVVIDIGLYFWLSYFALGTILLAGSLYLGALWHKIAQKESHPTPYKMLAFAVLLPTFIALADVIFRYVIAQSAGQVSITVAGISNKIVRMTSSSQNSYFYTERFIPNDHLWLYAILGIVLSFLVGVLINRQKGQKEIAS